MQVLDQVILETDAWVTEFQRNLADLEKAARAQVEAKRPGEIEVTVTNADESEDGVAIFLNGG